MLVMEMALLLIKRASLAIQGTLLVTTVDCDSDHKSNLRVKVYTNAKKDRAIKYDVDSSSWM